MNILFEDQHIIVCEKPAGVPSQSDKTGDYDMVNRLKNYLHEKDESKQPYIGLLHRLDRPVGGIMVFAKTAFAAKELSEQIRMNQMGKYYLAVLTTDLGNEVGEDAIELTDYLEKNAKTNLSTVSSKSNKNAKCAKLKYKVLNVINANELPLSLVEIELITGRHHQIRVQMSHHKAALYGDTKYNPLYKDYKGWIQVALYAYRLEFTHPKTKKKLEFCKVPEQEPFNLFEL